MKKLFEDWRKHLEEGEVIQGPWKSAEEKEAHRIFLITNAGVANDIEEFIDKHMQTIYGPIPEWTREQLVAFHEIDNLLNILFPSGG
tara:strand:- start:60 stop:320 length:261 start_codon:yes stop_codon:yes gene_type:complete